MHELRSAQDFFRQGANPGEWRKKPLLLLPPHQLTPFERLKEKVMDYVKKGELATDADGFGIVPEKLALEIKGLKPEQAQELWAWAIRRRAYDFGKWMERLVELNPGTEFEATVKEENGKPIADFVGHLKLKPECWQESEGISLGMEAEIRKYHAVLLSVYITKKEAELVPELQPSNHSMLGVIQHILSNLRADRAGMQ